MVAGGGADGHEGRNPVRAGDAFFIRLKATVGFYCGSETAQCAKRAGAGGEHDPILAARSR